MSRKKSENPAAPRNIPIWGYIKTNAFIIVIFLLFLIHEYLTQINWKKSEADFASPLGSENTFWNDFDKEQIGANEFETKKKRPKWCKKFKELESWLSTLEKPTSDKDYASMHQSVRELHAKMDGFCKAEKLVEKSNPPAESLINNNLQNVSINFPFHTPATSPPLKTPTSYSQTSAETVSKQTNNQQIKPRKVSVGRRKRYQRCIRRRSCALRGGNYQLALGPQVNKSLRYDINRDSKVGSFRFVGCYELLNVNNDAIVRKNSHMFGLVGTTKDKLACIHLCRSKRRGFSGFQKYWNADEDYKNCYCRTGNFGFFIVNELCDSETDDDLKLDVYDLENEICEASLWGSFPVFSVDKGHANKKRHIGTLKETKTSFEMACPIYQEKLREKKGKKCLVVAFGSIRGGPIAWNSLVNRLLKPLNCDLMLAVGENPENQKHCLWKLAKYKATIREYDDWGDYIREYINNSTSWHQIFNRVKCPKWVHKSPNKKTLMDAGGYCAGQFAGGIKCPQSCLDSCKNEFGIVCRKHEGSAGLLLVFRDFLSRYIQKWKLHARYDNFILTRTDHVYLCDHPKFSEINGVLSVPNGQEYGGFTDRHWVVDSKHVLPLLNITRSLFSKNSKFFDHFMSKYKDQNLETLLKFWVTYNTDLPKPVKMRRVMATVKSEGDKMRWQLDKAFPHASIPWLHLKYPEAMADAQRSCKCVF